MNDIPLFEPWTLYRHPLVRQLAFVIASPNLITALPKTLPVRYPFALHSAACWQQYYAQYAERLAQLDQDPRPVQDFLAALKSTRLGLRFEYLLWFWLTESQYHGLQLLGHSLQQIEGRHTRGELDFLILNQHTQEIEHWEVALKYYLGHGQYDMQQWIGLNDADTLARKLQHFAQRQFQFTQVNGYTIQRKYAVMKGQLYRPLHLSDLCDNSIVDMDTARANSEQHWLHTRPDWVASTREVGLWMAQLPPQAHQPQFRRLTRHEWICPNLHAPHTPITWWNSGLYLYHSTQLCDPQHIMLKFQDAHRIPYL